MRDRAVIESMFPSILECTLCDALCVIDSKHDRFEACSARLPRLIKIALIIKKWSETSQTSNTWFIDRGCLHVFGYLASKLPKTQVDAYRLVRNTVLALDVKGLRVLTATQVDPFRSEYLVLYEGALNAAAKSFAHGEASKRKRANSSKGRHTSFEACINS